MLKQESMEVKEGIQELKKEMSEVKEDVQELKEEMAEVREDVQELKKEMVEVKEDVQELKREMIEVKQGIIKIMLIIENELQPTLKLLVENFLPAASIYVESTKKITYLEQDVTVLKEVVGEHSKKLSTI